MTNANINGITIIKKYANRRLYDTGKSSYITLGDLAEMLREGHDFKVIDAKNKKDITHSILLQIIVDQESKEYTPNILSEHFLKELIKIYEGPMMAFVPTYLDRAMQNFVQSKEKMQAQLDQSFGSMMPTDSVPNADQMQQITMQNLEIMKRMINMFTPFDMADDKKGD